MADLVVEALSKRYRIQSNEDAAGGDVTKPAGRLKIRTKDFWALKNVSFEVARGESLGIIGHNGAGKSTILKILSNITTPTAGKITISGRIAALLEVGSGFHPELTGRENIFLSGSILGMRRAEITSRFDSIVAFAELDRFIEIPVKRYSSGMFVRLGFSIAAHLNPDILLLDEVLAVGDRSFQQKCKQRIAELHRQGMTMIFISHDLGAVRDICSRALLLDRGQVEADGEPDEIIRKYAELTTSHENFEGSAQIRGEHRRAELTGVRFFNEDGERIENSITGQPFRCRVDYLVRQPVPGGAVAVYFCRANGEIATQFSTASDGETFDMNVGPGAVEFFCPQMGLKPEAFRIDISVEQPESKETFEWQRGCFTLLVESGNELRGEFHMAHTWRHVT
ncbi:MAG: ABC transporter ATP-binding protein [Bryobacteraceae bacterium]